MGRNAGEKTRLGRMQASTRTGAITDGEERVVKNDGRRESEKEGLLESEANFEKPIQGRHSYRIRATNDSDYGPRTTEICPSMK